MSSPSSALDRLRAFVSDTGISHKELALALGCSQPHITKILGGKKVVFNVTMSARIEELTKDWRGGQILAIEWASPVGDRSVTSAADASEEGAPSVAVAQDEDSFSDAPTQPMPRPGAA